MLKCRPLGRHFYVTIKVMNIIWRLVINTVIIAGLFSFVPGVGVTTAMGLGIVALSLALINSLLPVMLPLAGIAFNLGSYIIALIIADATLVWTGIKLLGIIFVTDLSGLIIAVVVAAVISWFVQSLGFNFSARPKAKI